jgi:hypothetical protein
MAYSVAPTHTDSDRARMLALWERNLSFASPGRYDWLYASGVADGWLIQPGDEEAVGSVGLMSRTFWIRGESRAVGQAIDLNVNREHRTVGPAITLMRKARDTARAKGMDWIYGVSNPGATRLVEQRLGYRQLGPLERWVCPLRVGPSLGARMTRAWLGKLASPMLDPLLFMRTLGRPRLRDPERRVESTDGFDPRFDDLGRRAAAILPILGERTSAYLSWRFRDGPEFEHHTLCLVKNGGGHAEGAERAPAGGPIAAYIVYHRRGGLVYVGDFLFTDLDDFTLLMNEFIRRMHRERAEAVTTVFFGHPGLRRRLRRLGFWRIQTERSVVLNTLGVETSPETAMLQEPDSWFFTQADIDSDR